MPNYKKHYAFLCSTIDDVLGLMDNDDLLQWDKVKEVLQKALLDVEDAVIEEMEEQEELKEPEEPKNDEKP